MERQMTRSKGTAPSQRSLRNVTTESAERVEWVKGHSHYHAPSRRAARGFMSTQSLLLVSVFRAETAARLDSRPSIWSGA